jgi:hypothetical protein
VEVARHEYGPIDMTYHLGPKGIGENFEGIPGEPLMPFVGVDGQPSGATLDIDPLVVECTADNSYKFTRQGHSWDVSYVFPADVNTTEATPCTATGFVPDATRGPNRSVVLVQIAPQASGDILHRVTILGNAITSYDTDWEYVGSTNDALIFSKTDQDSVDIARLPI